MLINLINLKNTSTKSWKSEIELRCSFYEFVEERDYCKEVYSPYKSASLEDKKRIDSNGSIYVAEVAWTFWVSRQENPPIGEIPSLRKWQRND